MDCSVALNLEGENIISRVNQCDMDRKIEVGTGAAKGGGDAALAPNDGKCGMVKNRTINP